MQIIAMVSEQRAHTVTNNSFSSDIKKLNFQGMLSYDKFLFYQLNLLHSKPHPQLQFIKCIVEREQSQLVSFILLSWSYFNQVIKVDNDLDSVNINDKS